MKIRNSVKKINEPEIRVRRGPIDGSGLLPSDIRFRQPTSFRHSLNRLLDLRVNF